MDWRSAPYVIHLILMATASVAVALYAWRRRPMPGTLATTVVSLAVAEQSLTYAMQVASADLPSKLVWLKLTRLSLAAIPTMWLVLALDYTGRRGWLQKRYLVMLAIEPLVTLLLAWTNEQHHWIYSSIALDTSGPFPTLDLTLGSWSWFDLGYSYVLFLGGTFLLVQSLARAPRLYRKQVHLLLIAGFAPALAEIASIAGLRPLRLDLMPFAYTVTNVAVAWGLFRYRLLDILPVARDAVVESMDDGVLVLDAQDRIVDLNKAVQQIVDHRATDLVGLPIARVLPTWPGLIERHPDATKDLLEEIILVSGGVRCRYDLRVSPLFDQRGRFAGRLAVLRDMTEHRKAEERAQRLLDQQVNVNRLALALGEYEDLDRVYHAAYEHVRTAMDADTFIVSSYDAEEQLIGAEYVVESDHVCDVANFPPLPLDEAGRGTQSQVIRTGEPLYIPDFRKAREEASAKYTIAKNGTVTEGPPPREEESTQSALLVPMKIGGETVGVMQVQSNRLGAYGQEEADLLSAMANVAAVAIQNVRLYAEQQRRAEEAGVLLEISNAINSTLELDRILKEVALRAAQACGADRCTILLLDEQGEMLEPFMSQFASGQADLDKWRLFKDTSRPQPVKDSPEIVRSIETRLPIFIPDASASSLPRHWVEPFGVGSVLIVPLISRERVLGLMGLDRAEIGHAFAREHVNLAITIGGQAAVAIENARLHRQLRDYAFELERRVQERTAQLELQYAQLEAILASSSDGIIVTDRQGEILRANPVAQTWLSRTLSPEDAARLRETLRGLVMRAEGRSETVLELTGLDLELSAAPITNSWMEGVAVVIAIHDVSHLKALDRMKSRFIASVSHELRTPITTVRLYAELMKRKPERWQEYLEVLAQEADRQVKLVDGILQISRIDSGRLEIEPRPIPLGELAEAVLIDHRALIERRGLTLEYRPAEPELTALVDQERMTQVLANLVANAIQYTPEGGKLVVSIERQEAEDRAWATVTVADTGMGIPEEELPHVFDRFFRGEQPQVMQLSGTGLGLAIAKEIVELHGGWMAVESEVGTGTTFTVWLPLAQ